MPSNAEKMASNMVVYVYVRRVGSWWMGDSGRQVKARGRHGLVMRAAQPFAALRTVL